MKFISLFAGIGGFDLGFERAGMECAFQVEIDSKAQIVLNQHWPNVPKHDDIRSFKYDGKTVDLICGGFPCQDVSIAGNRAGLDGERSGLWREFLRVVSELRPNWVIIENVPGLLSSNRGKDFATIIRGLEDCGYVGGWRVLDSQYFGVPQRRRRVFVVGSLGGNGAGKVLFKPESLCWGPAPRRAMGHRTARRIKNDITATSTDSHREWMRVTPTLGVKSHSPRECTPFQMVGFCISDISLSEDRNFTPGVRRLTPTECERLQGFPDGWTGGASDTSRYRMLGNAVTVNVAQSLGQWIIEANNDVLKEQK